MYTINTWASDSLFNILIFKKQEMQSRASSDLNKEMEKVCSPAITKLLIFSPVIFLFFFFLF